MKMEAIKVGAVVIDGTLCDAIIDSTSYDRPVARGRIYGDRKNRFNNGDFIRTSFIVEGPDADGIIKTRNSVYKLEMADLTLAKKKDA